MCLAHLKPLFITHSLLFFLLIHLNLSPDAVLEPASGLGADLLGLYQRGEQCDITIQVAEQVFSCHRYKHLCRPFNPLNHTSGIQAQHLFFLCVSLKVAYLMRACLLPYITATFTRCKKKKKKKKLQRSHICSWLLPVVGGRSVMQR